MPVSGLHRQIAALALAAAGEHGSRSAAATRCWPTGHLAAHQDAGLFAGQKHGVKAAAGAVEAALRGAGFEPERQDQAAGLTGIVPGMVEGLAEWIMTASGGEQMALQLAYSGPGPRDPSPGGSYLAPRDCRSGEVGGDQVCGDHGSGRDELGRFGHQRVEDPCGLRPEDG
jgi:hypothetical protein